MKKVFIIVLVGLISWSCQTKKEVRELSEEEVNRLVDRWLSLWSSYDLDLLDQIFWKDDQMTYFSSEQRGLIVGFDKMRPHHINFGFVAGGKEAAKSLWLEEIHTVRHKDMAVVDAVWYFGDRTIPKDSVQNGPVTFVMVVDQKDQLKIAHTHFANYE